ncbi:precorrin-8X methylmutase, partial [Streptomyces niveus]
SKISEKGGSAVAAAALNALLYHPYHPPQFAKENV